MPCSHPFSLVNKLATNLTEFVLVTNMMNEKGEQLIVRLFYAVISILLIKCVTSGSVT